MLKIPKQNINLQICFDTDIFYSEFNLYSHHINDTELHIMLPNFDNDNIHQHSLFSN